MAINESVYGARENWIVPTTRTEQGTYISGISYDSAIDEINRIKIANYNTVDNPRTLMRTQMSGDSHSGGYAVNNEWLPTQTNTIDNSIVQFGIGPQSALSNIEWWGEVWASGKTQPDIGSHDNVELINSDHYDITNIAFAFNNTFRPSLYATTGSMAGNGQMNHANWQYLNMQLWGDSRCFYSSQIDAVPQSAYAFASLITQIPVKNIKIYPVISAYNSQMQSKGYSSIQDYLADKSNYPFIYCIYAKFASNTGKTWAPIDVSPWFFNITSIAKGFGNGDIVRNENIMYLRTRDLSNGFFVIGGCPNFNSQSYYQTNGFYWHYNTASVSFDVAELMPIYQPEDLKFEYDTAKNAFICDVSSMTDDQITERIRKQLASFGLFFVDSINDINLALDDEKTFLGILKNGVGYGDYSNGAKNREQAQWNWDTMEENDYDPSNPPVQDRSSDPVTFNPVSLADGGLKRYVLDDNAMSAFGVDLYRVIDTTNPDTLIQNQTLANFLTNNPLDAVVSVKRFPLPDMSQGGLTNIMLGKVQMQTAAKPFASTATILTCGSINIPAKFGNFLDYQTQYELILPFCGTISLDPKIVTGKNVEVKYSIDYTTGTCTAWILTVTSDGVETIIDSANGNCTIDIPLSGVQMATLTGEIYNANENLKTAKFNAVVNAVSGIGEFAKEIKNRDLAGGAKTVANVVNSIHDIKKSEWNINNTQIPFKMIGASSGCNAFQIELIPRLNVYYPIVDSTYNAADYRHNVGAAVCDTTTIGDYSGYAEITNVDLSEFTATADEKNMIANALMDGVYL